ncbi:hypothetical protein DCMF_04475 [Candidatus Formimonas warabiya]|uniref:Uncharacterized protein n=1 Tax=Formimonas warabiya TaxID=1761012 RepID=A0A3G1KPR5_FORW1|nr:hypothetical protein DCMF_04475 [Candidatus Formimonas warabiya]
MGKKPKGSFKDSRGKLFVDCAECKRGGNGDDADKCSSGWNKKRINNGGCFCGDLMEKFEI